MSEFLYEKGILKQAYPALTLEKACEKIANEKWTDGGFYNNQFDYFDDFYHNSHVIYKGKVYEKTVTADENPENEYIKLTEQNDGSIIYETSYYDGAIDVNEMIQSFK